MCTVSSEFNASVTDVIDCVSTSPSTPFCPEVCGSFPSSHCLILVKELEIRSRLSAFDFSTLHSQFSFFAQRSLWSHHIANCYIMKVIVLYFFPLTSFLENLAEIKRITLSI